MPNITLKEIKKAIKMREKNGVKPPHYMRFNCKDGSLLVVRGNTAEEIYNEFISAFKTTTIMESNKTL